MDDYLKKLFGPGGIGICVKDASRKVVFQNEICDRLCGNQSSTVCKKNCMEKYVFNDLLPSRSEGAQLFSNKKINNSYWDIVLMNTGKELVTLLYPVGNKHEKELEFFKDKGLSKREFEIVERVVRGMTNSEIIKELGITKATLKTHLNNVYKKLPPESRLGFRRRAIQ